MRRLLTARSTTTAAAGLILLLAAGGGYAIASNHSNTIHACVSHKGGAVYVAKKCAKHDKKISWNKVGPRGPKGNTGSQGLKGDTGSQGPGASYVVWNATGTASPPLTPIGTVGLFTFAGSCTQSGSTTSVQITATHPAAFLDGFIFSGGPVVLSGPIPAATNSAFDTNSSTTTTPSLGYGSALAIPSSGPASQLVQTDSVTGGATNSCHFSAAVTPTGLSTAAAAARRLGVATARGSGPSRGSIVAGIHVR